jgi:hypothetical protein
MSSDVSFALNGRIWLGGGVVLVAAVVVAVGAGGWGGSELNSTPCPAGCASADGAFVLIPPVVT